MENRMRSLLASGFQVRKKLCHLKLENQVTDVYLRVQRHPQQKISEQGREERERS